MEIIHVKDDNIDTIIYIDNKKYYGYKYLGNHFENIANLDILKPFILSKDYTKLPKEGKYEVYLDNQTGLRHYFYNNMENLELLFLNNRRYAINYLGKNNKKTKTKVFNFQNRLIICTLLGLTLALGSINLPAAMVVNSANILINDYENIDIKKMIDSSINLTEEEKEYLYNEQFINDFLEVVNDSYYEKNKLTKCFDNINIVGYHNEPNKTRVGYYTIDTPSTLYVKNYQTLEEKNKPTVAHEFAHLCQDTAGYNLIIEASADIITKEYYSENYSFGYSIQVKILKKLMETIGSYPIWYYNFTGDFSQIKERVEPYLTSEEYQNFLNDLSFDYDNKELNKPKYEELDEIIAKLYYRIYQKNIKDDEIISSIERFDQNLVRYYFNKSMLNKENSYYLDYNNGTYETLSYQEAIDRGIMSAYTISYIEITTEAAFKIIEDNSYTLRRDLNFHSHNIVINHSVHGGNEYIITGTIDGVKYEEANVDDLAKEGIIDVNYYIIDRKDLTSEDYKNHNYKEDEIYFIGDIYTKLNEDSINVLVPKKVFLPPINTRYENNSHYVKKKKITIQ